MDNATATAIGQYENKLISFLEGQRFIYRADAYARGHEAALDMVIEHIRSEKRLRDAERPTPTAELNEAYGSLFPLATWKAALASGAIIPEEDGMGYWATASFYDRNSYCGDPKPSWATHVMWFNK